MSGRLAAAFALAAAALGGCSGEDPRDPRPLVAVSVLPQAYAVDRLAGDRVRVQVLIPPGASPAAHEPDPTQLEGLTEAALYVKVGHPGLPLEAGWLERLLAESPELRVVDGAAGVPLRRSDPHVWLAPGAMEQMAVGIETALREILPDSPERLAANLAAFRDEITALDQELRTALAAEPRRKLLAVHPAWGHFAETYGVEYVAIEPQPEGPAPYPLDRLIDRARQERIDVVFVPPGFDPSRAETLARATGARVEPLDPLAYDWPAGLRRAARVLTEPEAPE